MLSLMRMGRGGPTRQHEVVERGRYQISSIAWDDAAIEAARARCGWRAYVTNTPSSACRWRTP